MTIKEKVLSSCKTSFAKYGLKKDELSKLVDTIVATRSLTDESTDEDVNGAITAFEPMVGMIQSSYNRAVSETTKKFEGFIDPKTITDPQPPKDPPTPPVNQPLTMEAIRKLIAENAANSQKAINDAVAAALAPYKEREERERLATLLQGSDKLKDIPKQFRERYQLDKEENLDTTAQKIADDWTALKQTLASSGQFIQTPKSPSKEDEQNDFLKSLHESAERVSAPKKD